MPPLLKITRDIEARLHALLAEVQELKSKARRLEQENTGLRKQLAGLRGENEVKAHPAERRADHLNLLKLYDQGFHICNINFGEERGADCLFCMAFLRKEIEGQKER